MRTLFAASLYTTATCCHVPVTRFAPLVTWSRHEPPTENPNATSSPNVPR
jgi:hypothetical protein